MKRFCMLMGVASFNVTFVLRAEDSAFEAFDLGDKGQLLLKSKDLKKFLPGLEKDLSSFDALGSTAQDGVFSLNKKATVSYLNSGWQVQPGVRFAAVLRLRQSTERVYGESDIFPPSGQQALDSLQKNDSLPPAGGLTPSERMDRLSRSVGLIVPSSAITHGFGSQSLLATSYRMAYGLCQSVPDAETPCVRDSGTGFLVSATRVATAGHCVDYLGDDLSIIFGYTDKLPREAAAGTSSIWVRLAGENVVVRKLSLREKPSKDEYSTKGDWAILDLDAPAPSTLQPLALNNEDKIPETDQNLVMLGHPCGLPLRAATKGKILHSDERIFMTNLDAFIGNSGSPVFNGATWKVEGLLIQGGEDFVTVDNGGCKEWVTVAEEPTGASTGTVGEKVGRILPVEEASRR